jgi:hypothetical protein
VNFIGHATVALWSSANPLFVLGSMLPDFAGMAGLRLPSVTTPGPLADGIALHHRTDEVFHASGPFLGLMESTLRDLTRDGVPRGPARAISHVGVELLVDGMLLDVPGVRDAYLAAIGQGGHVFEIFALPEQGQRWNAFEHRLRSHGVPDDYRNTDSVVQRLVRIFADRPRLALSANCERIARRVMPDVQGKVAAVLPELLRCLRNELQPTAGLTNVAVLVR